MFGPNMTPEPTGLILEDRHRLENASYEITRLQRELNIVTKEVRELREMNHVLSAAFKTSGHSALNRASRGNDNASCRTDAQSTTKSCTAPARHAPMTIQTKPGKNPHCAASTGPTNGPGPAIAAK